MLHLYWHLCYWKDYCIIDRGTLILCHAAGATVATFSKYRLVGLRLLIFATRFVVLSLISCSIVGIASSSWSSAVLVYRGAFNISRRHRFCIRWRTWIFDLQEVPQVEQPYSIMGSIIALYSLSLASALRSSLRNSGYSMYKVRIALVLFSMMWSLNRSLLSSSSPGYYVLLVQAMFWSNSLSWTSSIGLRRVNSSAWVLSVFILILFAVSHCSKASSWACNLLMAVFSCLLEVTRAVSSANWASRMCGCIGILFTYAENRVGDSTEPWGCLLVVGWWLIGGCPLGCKTDDPGADCPVVLCNIMRCLLQGAVSLRAYPSILCQMLFPRRERWQLCRVVCSTILRTWSSVLCEAEVSFRQKEDIDLMPFDEFVDFCTFVVDTVCIKQTEWEVSTSWRLLIH